MMLTPCLLLLLSERFALGPLGAVAEVEAGSSEAVVVAVDPGSVAERAGLRVGDRLCSAAGQAFPAHQASVDAGGRGPQKALGEAIDAAVAGLAPAATLVVGMRRGADAGAEDAESTSIELRFPGRGPLSGPQRRQGRAQLREAAARQLLSRRRDHGAWDCPVGLSGDRVTTAWAVIALLAHGDPDHAKAIDAAVAWLRGPDDRAWLPADFSKGPDNLGNWALTSTVAALAEHDHARGTEQHRELLTHIAAGLAARMTPEGLFGHDVGAGYDGKGFNVINTLSHMAWGYCLRLGIPIDEAAWTKSQAQILASIDPDHGVRYWTLPGTGTGDASLRTASMALGLHLSGREREQADGFVRYLDRHAPRTREAHAVGSLGMLTAAPALRAADPAVLERFLEEWRWYLCLMWGPDDRIHYIGGKGNNGGDSYLGFDLIAATIALQLLACEDGRLLMHQRHDPLRPPRETP